MGDLLAIKSHQTGGVIMQHTVGLEQCVTLREFDRMSEALETMHIEAMRNGDIQSMRHEQPHRNIACKAAPHRFNFSEKL